jgi:hypothetical protein
MGGAFEGVTEFINILSLKIESINDDPNKKFMKSADK